MNSSNLEDLYRMVRSSVDEHDWIQFHTPKNLAIALNIQAGEVLEPLKWRGDEQLTQLPPEIVNTITDELSDVLAYLLLLSAKLQIDLGDTLRKRLNENPDRYTPNQMHGKPKQ